MARIGRRAFLATSGAFVALRARGDEKPLWKAGIVTDTHVKRTRESCDLVKKACDLFAEKGIDIFINCGDIADHYYPEAYPILKELTDTAFPAKTPKKIWVIHIHTPPTKNQMTFISRLRHPCCCSFSLTWEPKGHRARMPSLKLCNPNGMPIMVIIKASPPIRYSMAICSPPKITQMMFPSVFIF